MTPSPPPTPSQTETTAETTAETTTETTTTTTDPPPQTFHPFADLPPELRLQIWTLAHRAPAILLVTPVPLPPHHWQPTTLHPHLSPLGAAAAPGGGARLACREAAREFARPPAPLRAHEAAAPPGMRAVDVARAAFVVRSAQGVRALGALVRGGRVRVVVVEVGCAADLESLLGCVARAAAVVEPGRRGLETVVVVLPAGVDGVGMGSGGHGSPRRRVSVCWAEERELVRRLEEGLEGRWGGGAEVAVDFWGYVRMIGRQHGAGWGGGVDADDENRQVTELRFMYQDSDV